MARISITVLLFALPASCPCRASAAAQGAECEAAFCIPAEFGRGTQAAGVGPDWYMASQVFVPRIPGALDRVVLGLWSTTPGSAIPEIRTVADGLPTATILARVTMLGRPYDDDRFHEATFAGSRPVLMRGVPYALVVRAENTRPIEVLACWPPCRLAYTRSSRFADSDDGGATWRAMPPLDRTFVYRVRLDAATPAGSPARGRLELLYR